MCTMNNNTPLLIKLSILTLVLLLPSATSSYPSHFSPSPSPSPGSPSPLTESPPSPSDSSYSPPAPPSPSPSHSPTNEDSTSAPVPTPTPTPADDNIPSIPTPPPVPESVTNAESINYIKTEPTKNKSSGGGNRVGVAFGLIGAACVVIFGGAVYKKRRDNIRRSRRYSRANIQLI